MDKLNVLKIVVIGTSCSGKTTLASKIAQQHGLHHIHLDSLHWLPHWQERSDEDFAAMTEKAVSEVDSWVCDGNYSVVREIVWRDATHIIWLNYPFFLVFWRGVKRTCRRVFLHEEFVHGNYEGFRHSFLSRHSILWWIMKTHSRRKKTYPLLLAAEQQKRNVHVMIVHRPHEIEKLLPNFFAMRES